MPRDHWREIASRLRTLAANEVKSHRERGEVVGTSPLTVRLLEDPDIVVADDHDDVDVTDAVRRSDVQVGDLVLLVREHGGWVVTDVVSDRDTGVQYG